MVLSIFCISLAYDAREIQLLMKKISTGTETLRVFREERDAAAADATKTTEEAEEVVVHGKVLAEMVSPS
jgi:hypothetical protein